MRQKFREGVNYFFTRNFGVGLEGSALRATGKNSNNDVSGDFGLNLIGRLPIANTGWASVASCPVAETTSSTPPSMDSAEPFAVITMTIFCFQGHVGLGVEYRFTRNVGAFADGRYTFVEKGRNDYGLIRTGVRFAF